MYLINQNLLSNIYIKVNNDQKSQLNLILNIYHFKLVLVFLILMNYFLI